MRRSQNLFMICAVVGFILFAPRPARAQSHSTCSSNSGNLSIKPDIILDCLRAGNAVNFDGITVKGDLDLTSLPINAQQVIVIPTAMSITNSHFTGSVISYDGNNDSVLIFQEPVDLRGSRFAGSVDFTGTSFEEFVHFENTHFESVANFTQVKIQNGAFFRKAIFDHSASFMLANIAGGIDFSEAQFFKSANFSMLHSIQSPELLLQADISFSGTRFTGAVYFMDAFIENPVLFNDAIFRRISPEDTVQFTNSTFTSLDWTNADFERGQLDLSGQQFEALLMPNFHPSILTPQNSIESLSVLKDNFRKQGSPDIANEISYWQNGIQRREKHMMVQILETIFLDWTFGYGLKPFHSVILSVLLILFFAIFYYPEGTLRPTTFAPSKPREWKFTIRLVEIPIAHDETSTSTLAKNDQRHQLPPQFVQAWQAIAFSTGVFTKLSSGKYVAVRAGSLVIAEWIIGLMVMAGFLFSLANTNPLLRSILDLFK